MGLKGWYRVWILGLGIGVTVRGRATCYYWGLFVFRSLLQHTLFTSTSVNDLFNMLRRAPFSKTLSRWGGTFRWVYCVCFGRTIALKLQGQLDDSRTAFNWSISTWHTRQVKASKGLLLALPCQKNALLKPVTCLALFTCIEPVISKTSSQRSSKLSRNMNF